MKVYPSDPPMRLMSKKKKRKRMRGQVIKVLTLKSRKRARTLAWVSVNSSALSGQSCAQTASSS